MLHRRSSPQRGGRADEFRPTANQDEGRNRERGEQQDEAERETPGDVATLSNPSLERIATSPSS